MDDHQLVLTSVFERARREFPNRQVVSRERSGLVTLSYGELFGRVDRLAHALSALGIERGQRVATIGWNHHRHLELYLAVTASGAVLHTVNARLASDQARAVIEHAGDVVIFGEEEFVTENSGWFRFADTRGVVSFDGDAGGAAINYDELLDAQPSAPFDYPRLDEREPAAMAYSSATTGRPKGVMYSHRALYLHTLMLGLKDTWAISESDTVMPVVPMYHVNAWGLPFAAIWMGAGLVLPGRLPKADDLVSLLQLGVTFAAAVPTVWMDVVAAMDRQRLRLPALRMVVSGGAPLPGALLRETDRLGVPLIHSYGMTEASPLVCVGQVRSDLKATEDLRLKQGYVVPGLDYEVRADDGSQIPRDGKSYGELWLRGPWIADGYERDERSKDTFADGWYRTGDVVTVDATGYLHVVDRKNDMIKSGGEWISTIELEEAISAYPGIAAVAVIGVPDERWQERPRAYVVCSEQLEVEALKAHLGSRVPRFWIPDEIRIVDALPLTSVGKYDKRRLREEAVEPKSAT